MTISTATVNDLHDLKRIAAPALPHDRDAADVIDLLWGAPTARPELRVVAPVDGAVAGFALASLRESDLGRAGHVDLIAVAPEHQSRGLGRALLAEMEERLRAAGAERLLLGGNTPFFAWPGIDTRYTRAVCMATACGYKQVRHGVNMSVDLASTPLATSDDIARLGEAGIEIRRLRPDDLAEFEIWAKGWGGTWASEAARAVAHEPARIHVAVRDGAYVGFACHGVNRRTWFGPMGTDAAERGRGIGAVLLRECLADLRADGAETAEIAWVGPIHFYARTLGAELARIFWIYEKAV